MSYLVFARKYRPQSFDTVVGQKHVTHTFAKSISAGRVAHAVLLSGPRGTGKTTVARILAKAMNCIDGQTPSPCNICRSCTEITLGSSVDVLEIDGASNNGVENVRDLRDNVKYKPAYSRYKVYIIDEVHMLSTQAFNALLKTLEEPPPHVMFIFATTEPHKIPVTILSRCQRHDFKRISLDDITEQMVYICKKEKVDVSQESLTAIARAAGGCMRDALSLLDLVLSCSEGRITEENLSDVIGLVDRRTIFKITDAVLSSDVVALLDILDDLYQNGHNFKELYSEITEHFRNLLVVKMGKKIDKLISLPSSEIDLMTEQVKSIPETFLNQIFDILYREESAMRFSPNPKLALEIIFFRMLQIKPALPIELLIEKIDGLIKNIPKPDKNSIFETKTDYKNIRNESSDERICEKAVDPYNAEEGYETGSEKLKTDAVTKENDLIKIWKSLHKVISEKYPSLAANMAKCSIKKIEGNIIVIEVEGNGYNFSRITSGKSLDNLKKICNDFFGKNIEIVFEKKISTESSIHQKNISGQFKDDALNNPIVGEALNIFNGSIHDVKIL
ncbi:MAG: DNA polymerase III subunit gamma/tau [Proteobacteria bacterium]|nr:DNA polymerase III subunit gamma/tau [Pseudomonadota bacterium]MBU4011160.1 DNA polymerase III subunit gamma/tau [Pseudomonadota bacterium]